LKKVFIIGIVASGKTTLAKLRKRKIRIFFRFLKQKMGIEKCHYKSDIMMLKKMYQWTHDFENHRDKFEAKLLLYQNKVSRLYNN